MLAPPGAFPPTHRVPPVRELTRGADECGNDDGGEEANGGGMAREDDDEGGECTVSSGGDVGGKARTMASGFAAAVAARVSGGAWCCKTPMFVRTDGVVVVAGASESVSEGVSSSARSVGSYDRRVQAGAL